MIFRKINFFSGFTLIEVMVTVTIIALLIALSGGIYLKNISKSNDSRRKSDLNRIKIAVEEYEKDNHCYPLTPSMNQCTGASKIGAIPIEPYLKTVPCDPTTEDHYEYETDDASPTCPRWFRIYAKLQNNDDPDAIPNIGPGSAYNYYVSSDNAPPIVQCGGFGLFGCIGGQCLPIPLDENCEASCVPNYADPECFGRDCAIEVPCQ